MEEFTATLVIVVCIFIFLFEAGMLYLCYQTHNMICDIRDYIARGRGKK